MNYRNRIRALALILLLALMGTSATAATLPSLLKYAKAQGFTVKTKSVTTKKATLTYAEATKGSDKLTWTDTSKKSYTITASSATKKTKLRDLCVYLANNYKWYSCVYKIDGVATYGYNVKKATTVYKTLALYRKAVKKYVASKKTAGKQKYVLNTSTMKFHLPTCSDVARINAENRKDVKTTRDALISEGYTPCGHCKP